MAAGPALIRGGARASGWSGSNAERSWGRREEVSGPDGSRWCWGCCGWRRRQTGESAGQGLVSGFGGIWVGGAEGATTSSQLSQARSLGPEGREPGSLARRAVMSGVEGSGAARGAGRVVDHRGEGGDRGAAVEGRFALDRVEHGRPQCPEVGRRAALLALGLLRGHVGGRADDQAGRGELRVALERGDAEVGQLGRAVAGDHDVARLDVAMDDPGLVGRLQRAGDLGADLGHPPGRQRPVGRGPGRPGSAR